MPTSVLDTDLVIEKTSWALCSLVPRKYHSPASFPSRTTTRHFDFPASATCAIWSSFAASSPTAAGATFSHSAPGTGAVVVVAARRARGRAAVAAPHHSSKPPRPLPRASDPITNARCRRMVPAADASDSVRPGPVGHPGARKGSRANAARSGATRPRAAGPRGRGSASATVVHDAVDDEAEPRVRCAGPQQHDRRVLLEVRSCAASGPDHEPALHTGDRSRDDVRAGVGCRP